MPVEVLEKPGIETPPEETEQKEPTEEEIKASVQPGKASALDPDFLLFLFGAGLADGLDLILDTIGLPSIIGKVIGIILDIFTFAIIGGWIYWKSKQFSVAGKLGERLKGIKGSAAKKIQASISKKIGSRVLRKMAIRAIPALILEVFPITGVFTSWTVAVISMLF